MQLYSRKESIERMNDLAGKGRPFLFIIDYKQEHSYVEEISEIDSSFCQYSFNGITNVEKRCEEYDGMLISYSERTGYYPYFGRVSHRF